MTHGGQPGQLIEFSYTEDEAGGFTLVTAEIGDELAGSVMVRSLGPREIGLAGLHVQPRWRNQYVATELVLHVIGMFPRDELWLYAEPFAVKDEPAGLSRDDLELFYRNLGFEAAVDRARRRAMVRRPG